MEITDIKTKLTLATVLSYYNLKPDKNLKLCCPFHNDKTPSMQVYYKTQTAYCFSSNCKTHGKSIDVIDFVLYKENVNKHEALLKAQEILNSPLNPPKGEVTEANKESNVIQLSMPREQFLKNMFTYFKNAVSNSKPARDYLQSRNLNPIKIEVGYNTAQFHHGQRRDETLINNCVAIGLLSPWGVNNRKPEEQAYKAFGKECICFALRNQSNHITGLYFRSTAPSNSPSGGEQNTARHFYLKESTGLYPNYPKQETEKLIIAESIIDAASLLQIESITKDYAILAAYGTNRLNEEMQTAIKELPQLKEIIFAFDNDAAGNAAAIKYAKEFIIHNSSLIITKLALPNKDVNETLQLHEENIFIDLLNSRTDIFLSTEKKEIAIEKEIETKLFIDEAIEKSSQSFNQKNHGSDNLLNTSNPYKLSYTTDTANYYVQGGLPKTNEHLKIMLVIEAIDSPLGVGGKARNKIDLYEDKQVEKLCHEVAEKLSVRKDLLTADLYRLTELLENHIQKIVQQNNETNTTTQILTAKERSELESFAKQPKLLKRINELLGNAGIVGEQSNRIFLFLIALSHKMPETLHALIQGSSGSGKTRLLKQVSDCMPKENVTKLTRLSDKVLYNFPENYFINRLLCLEDIDGLSEEAEFAFRELQSNGELNSATSIKLDNGQITSGQKTVKGPIASLACTTHGEIYEDNMSRVFLIAVDESMEQTKRIIEYQNCVAAGAINREDEENTKKFIQKFISIIQPYKVINPFAQKIQLPEEAQKIRRLNDLFQSFVKMITILNQYQRKQDERKRLVTEIEDIETAVAVMFESIVLKVDELDGSLRQFYEQLKMYLQQQYNGTHKTAEFTLREVRHALKGSKTQVFRYANDLTNLEYIKQCGGFSNRGFTYKIMYWDNYQSLREKIKQNLDNQIKAIKDGTPRNTTGTLQPL